MCALGNQCGVLGDIKGFSQCIIFYGCLCKELLISCSLPAEVGSENLGFYAGDTRAGGWRTVPVEFHGSSTLGACRFGQNRAAVFALAMQHMCMRAALLMLGMFIMVAEHP